MEALPGQEHVMSAVGLKSFSLMVQRKSTPSYFKSPTETMRRRLKAVVDAQKGHVNYWKHFGNVYCIIY